MEAVAELGQASRCRLHGVLVAVDAEHAEVVPTAQQGLAVSAAADRGVDDDAGRNRRERSDDFVTHDGFVRERLAPVGHSWPPAISPRPVAATRS